MQHVTVMEVSPRDGLQNEDAAVSTEDKLQLIDRAINAGCKRIEVTSFVHPTRVPQMADAEAVCLQLPQRGDITYTGLVLNERGYQRLLKTERLDETGLVVPASDTFGERNQGLNVADATTMARQVLRDARARGHRAQATIAVAFGCPFEGEVDADRVVQIACELAEEAPVEIALADTIGVGVPMQVFALFSKLREALGEDMPLRAHFHDTRNTGIANAYAALQAGVQTLDASIGGVGGCPFAPNASGNIATEDLVYMLNRGDIEHGVEIDALIEAAGWLEGVLDKKVPSMLLKAWSISSLTLADVQQAALRIQPWVHQTPVLTSRSLDALAGTRTYFKCENLQRTGSFKARGATNAVAASQSDTVATHSSGNHGAALAYAAQALGRRAIVVMPEDASVVKVENVARYGAQIVRCGPTLADRESCLQRVLEDSGAEVVPPYDDPLVISGQGTAALELVSQAPEVKSVWVPVGGGGLAAGSVVALRERRNKYAVRVFGAEPELAADAHASLMTRQRQPQMPPVTVADGLRTSLGVHNFDVLLDYGLDIGLVSEAEIMSAQKLLMSCLKVLVEPSSAVPFAALLKRPVEERGSDAVGLILTGGNVAL